jgi:predicted NBD/HSP70 family sugar kinase
MNMEKATRQQLKDHNTQLVLRTIFQHRAASRAEVARQTGLTKTTVSDIVANLMDAGLVEESGVGTSAGGKPPTLLNPIAEARQVICLDLESKEFRGALVNLQGQLRNRINIPTQGLSSEAALSRVYVLIESLLAAADAPVLGIGVGSPGLVDAQGERILHAVNLAWRDLPLGPLLQERFSLPVYISNDSQAAALAEFTYGNRPSSANMVLIKSGQGIGSGIIIQGEIFRGDGFGTGEIGHLRVVENGPACTCGNYGCLEAVASNRSLVAQALHSGRLDPLLAGRPEDEVFLHLLEAFRQGNPAVKHIANEAGRYFGIAVATLAATLNIHHVVISGAITAFGDILLNAIQEQVQHRVLPTVAQNVQVSYSTLGKDVVMLGAGALTVSKELGIS